MAESFRAEAGVATVIVVDGLAFVYPLPTTRREGDAEFLPPNGEMMSEYKTT
jgi:hypothetical protein